MVMEYLMPTIQITKVEKEMVNLEPNLEQVAKAKARVKARVKARARVKAKVRAKVKDLSLIHI